MQAASRSSTRWQTRPAAAPQPCASVQPTLNCYRPAGRGQQTHCPWPELRAGVTVGLAVLSTELQFLSTTLQLGFAVPISPHWDAGAAVGTAASGAGAEPTDPHGSVCVQLPGQLKGTMDSSVRRGQAGQSSFDSTGPPVRPKQSRVGLCLGHLCAQETTALHPDQLGHSLSPHCTSHCPQWPQDLSFPCCTVLLQCCLHPAPALQWWLWAPARARRG